MTFPIVNALTFQNFGFYTLYFRSVWILLPKVLWILHPKVLEFGSVKSIQPKL